MVRAYFGAKEITLIERPITHRGTLIEGEWVRRSTIRGLQIALALSSRHCDTCQHP